MGTGNDNDRVPWFKLSTTYYLDEKFDGLPAHAEVLFVRLLALARQLRTNGALTARQVQSVAHGLRSSRQSVAALCVVGLLSDARESRSDGSESRIFTIVNYRKWYIPDHGKTPAQAGTRQAEDSDQDRSSDEGAVQRIPRARARGPARDREKREREGSDRTPAGSVRSEPAGAAPRLARGAAQHPPDEPPDGDVVGSMSAAEAMAFAAKKIQEARNKNPAAGQQLHLTRRQKEQAEEKRRPSRYADAISKMDEILAGMYPEQSGGAE